MVRPGPRLHDTDGSGPHTTTVTPASSARAPSGCVIAMRGSGLCCAQLRMRAAPWVRTSQRVLRVPPDPQGWSGSGVAS